MKRSAHIVSAFRTPVIPRGGAYNYVELKDLAAPVLTKCLTSADIEPSEVDEVIVGNALYGGGNPARVALLQAGLPESVAGLTIDRQCCGGLDAILIAKMMVETGAANIVLAGGAESYSRRPARMHIDPDTKELQPYDQPPFAPWPDRDPSMHEAADNLAELKNISRERQDAWAIDSHAKAIRAKEDTASELILIPNTGAQHDAFARNLTAKLCGRAPTVTGSITSANTCVAADAAAFTLVVSNKVRDRLNIASAEILSGASVGGPPELPGLAPVAAIKKTLKEAGISPNQLSAAEIMEAYAVQAIVCVEDAGIPADIVNLGGGALARGHPIGASGAILMVRLFHELIERKGYGLAAIAAAGGIGTAATLRA